MKSSYNDIQGKSSFENKDDLHPRLREVHSWDRKMCIVRHCDEYSVFVLRIYVQILTLPIWTGPTSRSFELAFVQQ